MSRSFQFGKQPNKEHESQKKEPSFSLRSSFRTKSESTRYARRINAVPIPCPSMLRKELNTRENFFSPIKSCSGEYLHCEEGIQKLIENNMVRKMVREEKEDIDIFENLSLEISTISPGLMSLKKRAQLLKFSSKKVWNFKKHEAIKFMEDLSNIEMTPELIATILSSSEKGLSFESPQQIFNSLFACDENYGPSIILSPSSPGPLMNVVVPTFISEDVHEEMLSREMEDASALVHFTEDVIRKDDFERKSLQSRKRGRRRRPYKPLSDEDPPWSEEALLISIEAVGALPSFSKHPTDISKSSSEKMLYKETSKGIEYILDYQAHQYTSKVQLRGSQPPSWFPGYMVALSNTSDGVGLAKSASEVLLSAWRSVHPEVFSDSLIYN